MKADLKIKSQMGDIYTAFEYTLKSAPEGRNITDTRNAGGGYQLEVENVIHAAINNGGTEITFNTFSGDIFIRSAN